MYNRCEQCGIEFQPNHYHAGQRFCTTRCSAIWTARRRGQAGTVRKQCPTCGQEFNSFAGNNQKHCSAECYSISRRKERPKCEVCGQPVRNMRNRYCSKHCSNQARPRPGVNSWTGFYLRAQKANPGAMPCVVCGGAGEHRHHPDYGKPEFVVWLCAGCHRKLHTAGQRGKGGPKQRTEPPVLQ